MKTGAYKM